MWENINMASNKYTNNYYERTQSKICQAKKKKLKTQSICQTKFPQMN